MDNYWCDIGTFAASLEHILGDVDKKVLENSGEAVAKSTQKGVKWLRKNATKGKHVWSNEYKRGFKTHISKGVVTTGEIGNKNKPGLVHLLEKGHATLTGRRTNAYPHMAPAFAEMAEDFSKRMESAVEEALS